MTTPPSSTPSGSTDVLSAIASRPGVRVVIQCAMGIEAAPFLEALGDSAVTRTIGGAELHQQTFTTGELDGSTVMVVVSGIGLANSASATARALLLVDPDLVLAAGTTGGLHVDVEVGDVIAGVSTTYNGADATAFGYARGQVPQMPVDYSASDLARLKADSLARRLDHRVRIGQVVSGDSFVTAANVDPIRAEFPEALATDMETAAMAEVCYGMGVGWTSLRAVSDLCGPRADQDFHMDSTRAARFSYEAVLAFLSV